MHAEQMAAAAIKAVSGRTFAGRTITTDYVDIDTYKALRETA
jgi:hypothetical protein